MGLQTWSDYTRGVMMFPPPDGAQTTTASLAINTTGEAVGGMFYAPKTGSIDRVAFRTSTVTTGCTLDVGLESTDSTTGEPNTSQTLIAAGANGTVVVANTDDNVWKTVTIGTPPSVTQGQPIWAVARISSGTPSALNLVRGNGLFPGAPANYNCRSVRYTASAWTTNANPLVFAIRYSGDSEYTPMRGISPIGYTTLTISDSTNPDENGGLVVLPFAAQACGIWLMTASGGPSADFTAKIYNSDGTSLLASQATTQALMGNNPGFAQVFFQTPVTLAAGSYVVSARFTNATSGQVVYYNNTNFSNAATGLPSRWSRQNDGAWTSSTTEVSGIGLLLNAASIRDRSSVG